MKSRMLGYDVQAGTTDSIAAEIIELSFGSSRRPVWLACLNPHSYAIAKGDSSFRAALHSANWLVPDGIGIVLAASLFGRPLASRVTGFDIFERIMTALDERGGSVFFLGSSPDTLRLISLRLREDYPNVVLCGLHSPPFKLAIDPDENRKIHEAISKAKPDVLWVGLGAPKQEKWLATNCNSLDFRFAGAIGAVFDFYAGKIHRSPPLFQRLGLEWLPRLCQEPRRLWRRTAISAPIFLIDVVASRLKALFTR